MIWNTKEYFQENQNRENRDTLTFRKLRYLLFAFVISNCASIPNGISKGDIDIVGSVEYNSKGIRNASFSKDSNRVITYDEGANNLIIWDTNTGKVTRIIRNVNANFAISENRQFLAFLYSDESQKIWQDEPWYWGRFKPDIRGTGILVLDLEQGSIRKKIPLDPNSETHRVIFESPSVSFDGLNNEHFFFSGENTLYFDTKYHLTLIDIDSGEIEPSRYFKKGNSLLSIPKAKLSINGCLGHQTSQAYSGFGAKLCIWNLEGTELLDEIQIDLPQGQFLFDFGNDDKTAVLEDASKIATIAYEPRVGSIAFVLDGKTGSILSRKKVDTKENDYGFYSAQMLGFINDNKEVMIYIPTKNTIETYNANTNDPEPIISIPLPFRPGTNKGYLSPDGKKILFAHRPRQYSGFNGVVINEGENLIFNLESRKIVSLDRNIQKITTGVSFTEENSSLVISSNDLYFKFGFTSNPYVVPTAKVLIPSNEDSLKTDLIFKSEVTKNSSCIYDYGKYIPVFRNGDPEYKGYCFRGRTQIYDKIGNFLYEHSNGEGKFYGTSSDPYYVKTDEAIFNELRTGKRKSFDDTRGKLIKRSKSGKYIVTQNKKHNLFVFDFLQADLVGVYTGLTSPAVSVDIGNSDNHLAAAGSDGLICIWEIKTKELLFYLFPVLGGKSYLVMDKNYNYIRSNSSSHLNPGFSFGVGWNNYSFDQFDLVFNRPDKIIDVINKINPTEENIKTSKKYLNFWKQRVSKNGFNSNQLDSEAKLSNAKVKIISSSQNTTNESNSYSFDLQLTSLHKHIIGYKLFINGVPIYGDYIKRVYPKSEKQIDGKKVSISETVQLAAGENKIEVSAFTEDGIESPREFLIVNYTPTIRLKPDLYFVGISIDEYSATHTGGLSALTYAVKDSKELAITFTSEGKKNFGNIYSKLLLNKEVTQDSVRNLREFLSQSKVDDHVILFLSGHGIRKDTLVGDLLTAFKGKIPEHYKLRDKNDIDDVYYYMTSDSHVDRPWEKGIPLDSIRDLVNGIPSRQKIMFVDTCQSGEKLELDNQSIINLSKNIEIRKTRGKTAQTRGIRLVTTGNPQETQEKTEMHILQSIVKANIQKEMADLFPELRRGTGTIEISAATGAQSALESSEWKNGAFTYAIKEAILKGKAKDKKGNITAQSLRSYVLNEVEKLTDGQQTPMVTRDIAGRDFVIFGK
ncbi:hypothetical protein EHQ68_11070 [Leptospira congkakensis]|uniref:Peptidase C14 caspase domain-containing protein n=1 Tax=Leptospira congkakensis TaxID=2484932 RepID=A0A4Z1A3Z8_9LEPT|nr:WD40 repeat domain-containing protein [Leptospira congkakensis]TGL88353.1 hypothetical protein EHQ68_11070 [Leptospira congkakensis]TGL95458.1 hypothetical protein EHQ69_03255 [Leptospira congkakensis]TGL96540.1 hypothetical protein EHQ70_10305 [Leptospira congkakensis]